MSFHDATRGWLQPQHDLGTFSGRFMHYLAITDTRKLIAKYERGEVRQSPTAQKRLWEAYNVRDTMVHAGSGEVIPALFRRCYFVPVCLPLFLGFVTAPSVNYVIFYQTINQTYNTAMNWSNRGSETPTDYSQLLGTFGAATGSSIAVTLWLDRKVLAPLRASSWAHTVAGATAAKFIAPYVSTVLAGTLNCVITRKDEVTSGIEVKDDKGRPLGKSITAGRDAVLQTVASRLFLPLPGMLGPTFTLAMLKRYAPRTVANKWVALFLQMTVLAGMLVFTLPLSMAPFPVIVERDVHELEAHIVEDLERLRREDKAAGRVVSDVDTVSYYRGM